MSDVRGQRAGRDGGPRGDPGEPGGGLAARRWRLPVRVRQAGGTAQQNAKVLYVTHWKSVASISFYPIMCMAFYRRKNCEMEH